MKFMVTLFLLMALTCVAVHQTQAYSYAPSCKVGKEPCYTRVCVGYSRVFRVPVGLHYGCCQDQIYDRRNYMCAKVGGVDTIGSCNPCTQFRCRNANCVHRSWRCNGINECLDGSDEVGCGSCSSSKFRCHNGRCIGKSFVCDMDNDCGDGSDEVGCIKSNGLWCGHGLYRCDNDRCISRSLVCNGRNNCGDNSDETGCQSGRNLRRRIRSLQSKLDKPVHQDQEPLELKLSTSTHLKQ